jgi:hypothetical protein
VAACWHHSPADNGIDLLIEIVIASTRLECETSHEIEMFPDTPGSS